MNLVNQSQIAKVTFTILSVQCIRISQVIIFVKAGLFHQNGLSLDFANLKV